MCDTELRRFRQFNCDKRRGNYCCTDCGQRAGCKNPCLNHPSRCGLAVGKVAAVKEEGGSHGKRT